jgi:polyphosphate kinase
LAPELTEASWPPLKHPKLRGSASIFKAVLSQDLILHFPYQSYDYVLRFFNEAAIDPSVEEIKVTLYRVASDSLIANALISAAMNGKQVTAFVEVKARFDEANNLKWAQKMEDAGVRLIYSLPGLKVHAKVALVKRREDQQLTYFAYFGTGNFHEGTARIYGDHGLLTVHKGMTHELEEIFQWLESPSSKIDFQHLLVAQHNMQPKFLALIQREIDAHQQHGDGRIIIKLNNLEDRVMIDKLYEASEAGVSIDLLVRGICGVVPDQTYSRNIRVIRLIDSYLEHARMFWFNNHESSELYLASADWMNRNLYRRIEVGFPILQDSIKTELFTFLDLQLQDNCKAYRLDANHQHVKRSNQELPIRAQQACYNWLAAL